MIICIICILLVICIKHPSTYAYFKDTKQIPIDLSFTTGSIDVSINQGIDTSLEPGEDTTYNEFDITNEGTLNQDIKICFNKFSNSNDELLDNIIYELQLKDNENKYITVIKSNLSELKNTNLEYLIKSKNNLNISNNKLNFRAKLHISESVNEEFYNKNIQFNLDVKAYPTNDNKSNFIDTTYQTNSITIKQPEEIQPEPEPKPHNFTTIAQIKDGSSARMIISLKDYYNIDNNFKFDIDKVYGSFVSKHQYVVPIKPKQEIHITFAGEYIEIDTIDTHLPSKDKMEVKITYMQNNKIYTKPYIVEFTRIKIDTDTQDNIYNNEFLEAHFYEQN